MYEVQPYEVQPYEVQPYEVQPQIAIVMGAAFAVVVVGIIVAAMVSLSKEKKE